jgi:hypothetical protein
LTHTFSDDAAAQEYPLGQSKSSVHVGSGESPARQPEPTAPRIVTPKNLARDALFRPFIRSSRWSASLEVSPDGHDSRHCHSLHFDGEHTRPGPRLRKTCGAHSRSALLRVAWPRRQFYGSSPQTRVPFSVAVMCGLGA